MASITRALVTLKPLMAVATKHGATYYREGGGRRERERERERGKSIGKGSSYLQITSTHLHNYALFTVLFANALREIVNKDLLEKLINYSQSIRK